MSRPGSGYMLGLLSLFTAGMGSGWATREYTFCVVTAGRPGRVSYLERVAGLYRAQHVFGRDGVGLVIVDVDGWTEGRNETGKLEGVRLPDRALAVCDTPDVEGLPSCQVRQRTLDITGALSVCRKDTSGWVVLVEDDCEPCDGALSESLEALAGLDPAGVSMAKFSVNMCSTAFPAFRVADYSSACLSRLYTHPHDIIKAEDWAGPATYVSKHSRNLWHHIGNVSTEEHKNQQEYQEKYRGLRADTCFERVA